jgi:glucose/mannose transport system permease protein
VNRPHRLKQPLSDYMARSGLYVLLVSFALLFLLPMLLVVINSFKPLEEMRQGTLLSLPQNPTTEAWKTAWASACTGLNCEGIRPGLWNSVRITIPAMVISTLAGALNGYALSQWRTKLIDLVLLLITIGLFIPYQAMIYPVVKILSVVGMFRSYTGIVFVHVIFGLPYVTLLLRNFYLGIPDEISRAARMEGATFLRTFWAVILPMSRNILIVVAVLQFTGIWNDYLLGLIFAGNSSVPMTVQLTNIVSDSRGTSLPNVNMAAALIAAMPTLAVYLLSGRYFVRGIAAGAVKG